VQLLVQPGSTVSSLILNFPFVGSSDPVSEVPILYNVGSFDRFNCCEEFFQVLHIHLFNPSTGSRLVVLRVASITEGVLTPITPVTLRVLVPD
jgi:hypothetical protein